MSYCPCVMLGDLTTCYSIESAWFQRLKLKYIKPLSEHAFNFKLRRYKQADGAKDAATINHESKIDWLVGTDGQCSPRHQTHFEPSFHE